MRLDLAVVARGLARSRTHAQSLISAGSILVDGAVASKPALTIRDGVTIELAGPTDHYVSRAAHKLIGALDECEPLGLAIAGRVALDAGASTGGFTQVLLERSVAHVTAVDVGHDQLADQVRADDRVTVVEGVNVRELEPGSLRDDTNLVVADLSFISLTMVIPALVGAVARASDFVLMVKPQFEVGRQKLGKNGIVTDQGDRADAVAGVVTAMRSAGLTIHHVSRSALPGPHGNVEFFVWGSSAWQAGDVGDASDNELADVTGARERPTLDASAAAAAIDREVAKG
ncbi:TlyA family RNA methyltransferase [Demequina aurantiaca]|uniref:TlyA family RNA methyltransferase n=1 Tax=Demequina aurantiaca TaxID=676200 RepID=UPI000A02A87D|nr:TlyA family RNA methyltransferase [Demequina aurantiaca]